MIGFKNKQEFEEWARDQFDKYGIRQPETYTLQELKDLNPAVPTEFINEHIAKRDKI